MVGGPLTSFFRIFPTLEYFLRLQKKQPNTFRIMTFEMDGNAVYYAQVIGYANGKFTTTVRDGIEQNNFEYLPRLDSRTKRTVPRFSTTKSLFVYLCVNFRASVSGTFLLGQNRNL